MMKQVLLPVTLLFSVIVNAQTIKLTKGQQLNISSTIKQEMDLGMAGQMTNDISSTSTVTVDDTKNNYALTAKVTRLKMNMDGMGQQQSFDSDKPEDKDSEAGKMLGSDLGKEQKMTLDHTTGKITLEKLPGTTDDKKDEDDDNPLAGMMDGFGDANKVVESVFFILPAGKKIGDSWSDSSTLKNNSKVYKTYTLKSMAADIATIGVFTKSDVKLSQEMQGMQIDVQTNTKSEGEIHVNTKTSVIQKMNSVADITGTMEMMGQSMPISSKMTSLVEIK